MNTTALTRTALRIVAVVVAALSMVGLVGAPSQAATPTVYEGQVAVNSYYGWVSGQAYIPYGAQNYVSVSAYHRDVRNDGYCSAVHYRGVWSNGSTTGWYYLGNNCSTTNNAYSSKRLNASSGAFINAQVRVCQSDRYGNVAGTCSSAVQASSWRLLYS